MQLQEELESQELKNMLRKLTAQQEMDSDLDELQEAVLDLDDSMKDIEYINSDLARTISQIDQAVSEQEAYPLPNTEQDTTLPEVGDGMAVAAKLKFSPANKGGLIKVRRSASKQPSFAPWEIDQERNG
jgi:hypothetical protein